MARRPAQISKPLALRMKELLRSLLVVRDCLDAVAVGHTHLMLPLFGQLRALLTEKAKSNRPLLTDLAEVLGKQLRVWAFPGTDEDNFPELGVDPILRIGGLPVSAFQTNPHQKQLTLNQFLEQKMLLYKGTHYSRRTLIKLLAEKAGGAHFPPSVPADLLEISSLELNGQPVIHEAVRQLASATLEAGAWLLGELCDLSHHFYALVMSAKTANGGVLFDCAHPTTAMRLWLRVSPWGQLSYGMIGLDGFRAEISSERLVDWTRPRHIAIEHRITNRLDSVLTLSVDGEVLNEVTVQHPLFVIRELREYTLFCNRTLEDPSAGLTFAYLTHLALPGALTVQQRCTLLSYFDKRGHENDASCLLFQRNSYGEIHLGQTTMQLNGPVVLWDWRKLVAGQLPPDSPTAPDAD